MVPCWDGMSTLWVPFVGPTDCAPSRPPDAMGHAPDSRARCALSGPARERGERGRPLRLCRGGGGASLLRVAATIPFLIPVGSAPDVVCGAARTSSVGLQHKLAKRSSAGSYFHANDVHALWRGCLHNKCGASQVEHGEKQASSDARQGLLVPRRGHAEACSRRASALMPCAAIARWRRSVRRGSTSHPVGGTIPSPGDHPCLDPQVARTRARPTPRAVRRTAARAVH